MAAILDTNHEAPSHEKNTASPVTTTGSLLARLLRKGSSRVGVGSATKSPQTWKVSIFVDGRYFSVSRAPSGIYSIWHDSTPSFSWAVLNPLECPVRFIRSSIPLRDAPRALPFLIEPQLPLPLDDCRISGVLLRSCAEDWECLVSYARKDTEQRSVAGDALLPGSLAVAGILEWLQEAQPPGQGLSWQGASSDGIWGISFPGAWLVVLIVDGRPVGVRSTPKGDIQRLSMAQLELQPHAIKRWVGESPLEGWASVLGPPWNNQGEEWLALCALVIAGGGAMLDARPMTFARRLDQPWVRRGLYWAAAACTLISATLFLGVQFLTQEWMQEAAISRDEISLEMSRLSKEILDASSPFRPEPPLPRCSQVLRWIAAVPGLNHDEILSIERFRYQITQYPTAAKEREQYAGKVQLELACRDAFRARQILDYVSATDVHSPIETKIPLEWTHHQGLYRLSFTLKPLKKP